MLDTTLFQCYISFNNCQCPLVRRYISNTVIVTYLHRNVITPVHPIIVTYLHQLRATQYHNACESLSRLRIYTLPDAIAIYHYVHRYERHLLHNYNPNLIPWNRIILSFCLSLRLSILRKFPHYLRCHVIPILNVIRWLYSFTNYPLHFGAKMSTLFYNLYPL